MRVQIPAYTDRWMMGDQYGEVTMTSRSSKDNIEIIHVKLDKSGKTVKVILADCTIVNQHR